VAGIHAPALALGSSAPAATIAPTTIQATLYFVKLLQLASWGVGGTIPPPTESSQSSLISQSLFAAPFQFQFASSSRFSIPLRDFSPFSAFSRFSFHFHSALPVLPFLMFVLLP
jgi:hypothetical protein